MNAVGQTQAVRQIYDVENGQVIVRLPADFTAKRVEVIVLPVESVNGDTVPVSTQPNKLLQRILAWDISRFGAEQMQAYHRLCTLVSKGRKSDEPRIFGAFEGLVWMADDFNTMSEEELGLFYADISTNSSDTKAGAR
jgi:hypothetical protein